MSIDSDPTPEGPERLLPGALEAIVVQANYVWREGWQLTVRGRRQFQDWAEVPTHSYRFLVGPELLDVVASEISRALDLERRSD